MGLTEQRLRDKSKNYFDKLAAKYDQSWDGKYCLQMYANILEKISTFSFLSVLDVGCGWGSMLDMIKTEYPEVEAAGLDLSEKMIEQAQSLLGSDALLRTGDVEDIPWPDDSFDLLLCNSSFHHYPNPQKSLQEMQRVLKPQGRLLIGEPWWSKNIRKIINFYLRTPLNLSGDVYIYSRNEMENLLAGEGFRTVDWDLVDRTYYILTAVADK